MAQCIGICQSLEWLACRELSQLLRRDVQLLVRQSRPKAPMATRNLYLQARPIEVYPVISALLPGCAAASVPSGHLELPVRV